jgi:16S rRNA U1498 N3-methylase RsmE
MKKFNPDFLATGLGLLVAIANAWMTIDWDNFEWSANNCIKLGISAVIAMGGYVSTIKVKKK